MKSALTEKYRSILDDAEAFNRSIHTPLSGSFWLNPTRCSAERLLEWMRWHGISCHQNRWQPGAWLTDSEVGLGNTLPFTAGWYSVQEEIAMTAVRALAPASGDRVLDLCAAPGGKTAQIALAVGNTGSVVANEKGWQRLASLVSRVDHLGLPNVAVTHGNGMVTTLEPKSFDKVLADVPCSGEGTVRKYTSGAPRPISEDFGTSLPDVQKQLLRRALRLTKPGGVIVYSTCTFAPEENEAVLSAALADLGVVEPFDLPGLRAMPGLRSWRGVEFREDVVNAHRYYPHLNNTGGFFVARIRRTERPYWREPPLRDAPPSIWHPLATAEEEAMRTWLLLRYGVPESALTGLRFFIHNHTIRAATTSLEPPNEKINTLGVSLAERTSKGFLLTAFGAQLVAPHARMNVLELATLDELSTYLQGRPLTLTGEPEWGGTVIVRYRDLSLGKGIIRGMELESQLPNYLRRQTFDIARLSKQP
jgi:16S rRNA C967 or C1407 C5-methylase (RsmB/RsmF family)/NOL1/NOP2/fmu family ribosome biogenesis protein